MFSGGRLTGYQLADANGDWCLSVTMVSDSIIAVNTFVSIDVDVNAEAELLSLRMNVER